MAYTQKYALWLKEAKSHSSTRLGTVAQQNLVHHTEYKSRLSSDSRSSNHPHPPQLPRKLLSTTSSFFLFLSFLLSCVLYHLSSTNAPRQFVGFSILSWSTTAGYEIGATPNSLYSAKQTIGSFEITHQDTPRKAITAPFVLRSSVLALEYSHHCSTSSPQKLIITEVNKTVATKLLPCADTSLPLHWEYISIQIPDEVVGKNIQITLTEDYRDTAKENWIALRNRLHFVKDQQLIKLPSLRDGKWQRISSLLLGILSITALLSHYLCSTRIFLIFLLLSLVVFLKHTSFFYFDEWHVLERYKDFGASGIFFTHNEHFLPLFFIWYYLEALLFGQHYSLFLFTSALLHAINAFLLIRVLKTLRPKETSLHHHVAQIVIGFLFLISSLHGETMHWAFEQCIILAHMFFLVLLLKAMRLEDKWKPSNLFSIVILSMAIPLFFGNGFSSIIVLGCFTLFSLCDKEVIQRLCLAQREKVGLKFTTVLDRNSIKRSGAILIACGTGLAASALLYWFNRESTGHSVEHAKPFDNLQALFEYLFVGSQMGTILRGLGLYPVLDLQQGAKTLPLTRKLFGFSGPHAGELFLASLGFIVFTLIACASRVLGTVKRPLSFCILGQGIIISSLLLPSLGRWHFGVQQSLSLRYHYTAALGLCIMLYPLLVWTTEKLLTAQHRALQGTIVVILGVVVSIQLYMGARFTYFRNHGEAHEHYLEQLTDWRVKLSEVHTEGYPGYEGKNTKLEGLQPLYPSTITPGRHPDHIYEIYQWLNQ